MENEVDADLEFSLDENFPNTHSNKNNLLIKYAKHS